MLIHSIDTEAQFRQQCELAKELWDTGFADGYGNEQPEQFHDIGYLQGYTRGLIARTEKLIGLLHKQSKPMLDEF